jgi:predicted acetyltransferase
MTIPIRTATIDDTEAIARLYAVSFPGIIKTHDEWCDDLQPNPLRTFDDIFVAERDGLITGTLTLFPQTMAVSGQSMKCGGIGSVAVLPEFRMNGIAKQLMMTAYASMRSTGTSLSLLYPFKHSFYQKLGYGLVGDIHTLTIPSSSIPRFSERDEVHPLSDHELPALAACYDAFALQNTCVISRSPDAWRFAAARARKNHWSYWCHHSDGRITGYMLIDEKDTVTVKEFVYLTPEAVRGLLGFLAVYKTQSPLFIPYTRDEFFHLLCTDPVDVSNRMLYGLYPLGGHYGHGYMLRIVDVHEALRNRRFANASGSATFHILDDQIPENSTTVSLFFDGDSVRVSEEISPNIVSLTISTFAQLYGGYLSLTTARRLGLLDSYFDLSFLDAAFALPAPHCLDFF